MQRGPRPDVIWCSNPRAGTGNRWAFPPKVEKVLREITAGKTVLHLFGGIAKWGTRIDIDLGVRPNVIADAWLPPFGADSFDVVILDPPYTGINQQMKQLLLRGAGFVARERVYWFHTMWVHGDTGMTRERSWLVRVGDAAYCRCLIEWRVRPGTKNAPKLLFTRGPAMKYNRWLVGNVGLPFGSKL